MSVEDIRVFLDDKYKDSNKDKIEMYGNRKKEINPNISAGGSILNRQKSGIVLREMPKNTNNVTRQPQSSVSAPRPQAPTQPVKKTKKNVRYRLTEKGKKSLIILVTSGLLVATALGIASITDKKEPTVIEHPDYTSATVVSPSTSYAPGLDDVITPPLSTDAPNIPSTPITEDLEDDVVEDDMQNEEIDMNALEQELSDYRKYCTIEYSHYKKDNYLFLPQEQILRMAEFAIEKVNNFFEESGKMSPHSDGRYVPSWLTPELIAGIIGNETGDGKMQGSFIEHAATGNPTVSGTDGVYDEKRAMGIMQEKPVYVEEYNRIASMYGAEIYDLDDRGNPLSAMERFVVINTYYASLPTYKPGGKVYEGLGVQSDDDSKLRAVFVIAHKEGFGGVNNNLKDIEYMLSNPGKTGAFGEYYYMSVIKNMELLNTMENDGSVMGD